MADTFTAKIRMLLQMDQGNNNLWGNLFNKSVIDLVEDVIAARSAIDVTLSNVSLVVANGAEDNQRPMFLDVIGAPGETREVLVPTLDKLYVVINNTSPTFDITIKTSANPGVVVQSGSPVFVWVDQVADQVRAIGVVGNTATAGTQFIEDTSSTFNNRTAGDLGATVRYSTQSKLINVIIDMIDVTISSTDFTIVWGGGVPAALIPGEATSPNREYPLSVQEAGVLTDAYISVPPSNASWTILKADGTAWTAATQRIIRQKICVTWESITD